MPGGAVRNLSVLLFQRRDHALRELDRAIFVESRGLFHVIELLSATGQGLRLLLGARIMIDSHAAPQGLSSVLLSLALLDEAVLALRIENLRSVLGCVPRLDKHGVIRGHLAELKQLGRSLFLFLGSLFLRNGSFFLQGT